MPALQLFCLPYAGASATAYLRWRRALPAGVELVPLEPPGRGARLDEPLLRDFDALAVDMTEQLCGLLARSPTQSPGTTQFPPFALFGHSMGGLLAWRVCHLLWQRGLAMPRWLVVSGCAAPSRRDPRRFASLRGDAALTAELRKHGGTPEAVFADAELLRLTLDVLDADYRVCESFRRGDAAPLPLPLHVFAGRDDPIGEADLRAWALESAAGHTLDWFAGGHFFVHESQPELLRRLGALCERPGALLPERAGRLVPCPSLRA